MSELVAMSRRNISGRALLLSDVSFSGQKTFLTVWMSKMDQYRKGSKVELGPCSEPELCPVLALNVYLQAWVSCEGYLFLHVGGLPLTRHQFWVVPPKALAALSLGGGDLSSTPFALVPLQRQLPWVTQKRRSRHWVDGSSRLIGCMFIHCTVEFCCW